MTRRVLIMVTALLAPVSAWAQAGATEASLKTVHNLLFQAVTSGNVGGVANLVHPSALGFFRSSEQLVQLRSGFGPTEVVPGVAEDLANFSMVPYGTVIRVVGDVGIVCMTSNQKPLNSKVKPRYLRATYVYTLVQGNWKLLSWHTSDTPLKQ